MEAFVARQPIFGTDRRVFAYELLFRAGPENAFGNADGDFATASLISDSLHLHGIDMLTNGGKCFINLTRQALLDEVYALLPPEKTVVEILETVEPDRDVLAACRQAREAGYLLALDDYVLDPRFDLLLPYIDILKVEHPALDAEQQKMIRQKRRQFGFNLLAEKIESHADFQQAKKTGYSLFQGYFFCRPEMIQSRRLPASRMNYLRFLQAINSDETSINEIEALIRQEVSLSYKLLRYLNSAGFGLRSEVKSIHHAITLLGQRPLRKWASLVAVNEINDDKPVELMVTSMTRARFCELLGEHALTGGSSSDVFMLGMFSLLDAMLDMPMPDVVARLALPEPIRNALTDETAALRPYIDIAVGLERADWQAVSDAAQALGPEGPVVNRTYREAITWSGEIMRELAGMANTSDALKAAS